MPIYLPPISRREFFKRAMLAGAGVALAPELMAAGRRVDADSWALFSDTHISADPNEIARKINMTEHLKSVSAEVLALPKQPAGLLLSGDCALNSGKPEDYKQFTSLLEPLRTSGMPVHLTLGNHDHRENFWEALKKDKSAKRPVADKQAMMIKASKLNWFVLDSLEKTLQTPGHLGQEQLDWLAKTLDNNKRTPAVVVIHHNPGNEQNHNGLKDTGPLLEVIRPRKQVKAWIYGHTHTWKIAQDSSGIHLVNLPPVAYLFREGDPAGWVHATLRKDGMKLELRCLDTKHSEHGKVVDLKWREA